MGDVSDAGTRVERTVKHGTPTDSLCMELELVVWSMRSIVVDYRESLPNLLDGELVAQLASAVLVGEQASPPERLFQGHGCEPPNRNDVLGIIGSVFPYCVSVGGLQLKGPERAGLPIYDQFCVFGVHGCSLDDADADVALLRNVHEDAGSDRQALERLGVPLAAAGRDKAVGDRIGPGARLPDSKGYIPVAAVPRGLR